MIHVWHCDGCGAMLSAPVAEAVPRCFRCGGAYRPRAEVIIPPGSLYLADSGRVLAVPEFVTHWSHDGNGSPVD